MDNLASHDWNSKRYSYDGCCYCNSCAAFRVESALIALYRRLTKIGLSNIVDTDKKHCIDDIEDVDNLCWYGEDN